MKNIVLFLILIFSPNFYAQTNLVPNYSFELGACPSDRSQWYYFWDWYSPTNGTPDCLDSCATLNLVYTAPYVDVPLNCYGYQQALTGVGYAGCYTTGMADSILVGQKDGREYIAVELLSPLVVGQRYYLSYNISLADSARYATAFGAALTVNRCQVDNFYILDITPKVNTTVGNYATNKKVWKSVMGTFIADSAYNYIILGNFDQPTPDLSVYVGGVTTGSFALPPRLSYYYLDNVCLSTSKDVCDATLSEEITLEQDITVNVFPNPFTNNITINSPEVITSLLISKMDGSIIKEQFFSKKDCSLDLTQLEKGVYIITVISETSKYSKLIVKE
ncbi:MAG: T9SS type A sorting domain-containing protein [Putridiphycobacter sp.]